MYTDIRVHKDIIYANGHVDGKVFCIRVNPDGSLEELDEASSGGTGPTHLAVSLDHTSLLIAHVSVVPLLVDERGRGRN